jgi:hypothetical protein
MREPMLALSAQLAASWSPGCWPVRLRGPERPRPTAVAFGEDAGEDRWVPDAVAAPDVGDRGVGQAGIGEVAVDPAQSRLLDERAEGGALLGEQTVQLSRR